MKPSPELRLLGNAVLAVLYATGVYVHVTHPVIEGAPWRWLMWPVLVIGLLGSLRGAGLAWRDRTARREA
ncbi:hypothetical protein [Streptomyces sp. NPDC051921]|uniref:hypothetical protein n=1 Tax=Streptomyces sp. NPDC051921 TaxID=3155806 RepID=UPI0034146BDE